MDFLASFYTDGFYQEYLRCEPAFAACVVGYEGRDLLQRALSDIDGAGYNFTVSHAESFDKLRRKILKSHLGEANKGLLKSEWCHKHQHQRFSCLLVAASWESYLEVGVSKEWFRKLGDVHSFVESTACQIVVVFLAERDATSTDENKLSEASAALRAMFGISFNTAVVVDRNAAEAKGLAKLRQALVKASVKYHKDEVRRLRDKRSTLAAAGTEKATGAAMVRNHFKTGWHYLVLRDHHAARKQMDKAYRFIRALSPKFASLETRVCASVILTLSTSLVRFCGEDPPSSFKRLVEVRDHIEWLEQAFTADYSPNCRALLRTVRAFLVADWYLYLAQESQDADPMVRRDYYFSAVHCLQETIRDLPDAAAEKVEIPSPPFMGTECVNDAYASVVVRATSKSEVLQRIFALLNEGCQPSAARGTRGPESDFLLLCGKRALAAASRHENCQEDSIFPRDYLGRKWRSEVVALTVARMIISAGASGDAQSFMYALVHILASTAAESAEKDRLLRQLVISPPLAAKEILAYPWGGLSPPFSAVPSFSTAVCESASEEMSVRVKMYANVPLAIRVEGLTVQLAELEDEEKNLLVAFQVPATDTSPGVLDQLFVFEQKFRPPHSGHYFCAAVCADVVLENYALRVRLNYPQPGRDHARDSSRDAHLLEPQAHAVVHVTRPAILASLDFLSGEHVEVVEGERFSVNFSVKAEKESLTHCQLRIPASTKLFLCEVHDASTNTALQLQKTAYTRIGKDRQVYDLPDFALPSVATKELAFHGKGLKNGVYTLHVTFACSTSEFPNLEVTKSLRVVVDPPFAATHTFVGSTQWSSHAGSLDVPAANTLTCRAEKNVLIKSKPPSHSGGQGTEASNMALYYAAIDEANCVPDARTFTLAFGECAVVHTQLTCAAGSGVTIRKIDVVCADGVDILYSSVGELPCVVEEGETVSLTATVRVAKRMGQFTPGFVRVLFSPQTSLADNLVVDLPLPDLKMQQAAMSLCLDYAETAVIGVPLTMGITLRNDGATAYSGEIALDTRNEDFLLSGRSRWKMDVGPRDAVSVNVSLIPVRCGSVRLPALQFRDGSLVAPVLERTRNTHRVTVTPGTEG